ncbi:MAG: SMC family ATPase, partial [Candidatus Methanomethylicaceae archaeon]
MILRRLRIKNIRSYDEGEVNFPNGIILFEGDIGSGKSTLLLAIEFALFGLGNEKGTSLLSLGKNEGEVELEFELKNKRVKVHRSLIRSRKKGGISQEDCWIEIDGRRMLLSPTEMKEKILEILGYNEPADPKAKSVIFRYAIYTPQEEMKEILNRPVDERLQTIRKALRLEDYKIARDNALTIAKELKIHAKLLLEEEKKIPDLENEKKKLLQEKEENFKKIEELENNLLDIEISIKGLESEAEILREEIEKLIGEAKRGEEIEKTIEDFKKKIEDLRNRINNDKQKSNNLKKQKDEILKIIKKPEKDLEIIENELSEVRKEKNKILEEVAKKDHLLSTYISLVERKVCPTCNQRVDHEEFLSRVNNLRIELDEINRKKKEIELNIEKLELMKKEAEEYKLLSMRLSNIEESILILEERILKDEEELNNLLKRNEELKEELKIAKEAADNYRKKKIELEKISNEIKKLMEKRRDLENKKSKLIADMEKLQLSINNLDQEINKIKEKANKGKRLLEYTTWLEECFIPALEKIEVTIFRDANREFNEEFSRFFSFMVDDPSKSVMIDEEFTPIVM